MQVKLRVLRSKVVAGGSAEELESALNAFYDSMKESEAEMIAMFYVADFTVQITYSG